MITKILALIIRFGIVLLKLELEKPEDFSGVEDLYDICFSPSRKVLSSYRLRENVKPIDKLCYLAKNETGSILCAVRYWPIKIQSFKFKNPNSQTFTNHKLQSSKMKKLKTNENN